MKSIFGKLVAAAFVAAIAFSAVRAEAATLYITEYANGITFVGSSQAQIPPQPAITDQTVALSGIAASSNPFNAKTHVISMICDEGCSIQIGASPTATTSNFLLQQGIAATVGVSPGMVVSAVANAAGNSGSGGGTIQSGCVASASDPSYSAGLNPCSQTLAGYERVQVPASQLAPIGQTVKASSVSVTVASDQNSIPVNPQAATTGGCTPYHLSGGTTASTNFNMIKSSAAGTLCSLSAINTTTTIYYLRVYDTASGPTCSSSTGAKHSIPIPPAGASGQAGGIVFSVSNFGESFANGIGYCVTGGGTDTDNTNAATGIWINGSYD